MAAIENYVTYNKGRGFVYILTYNDSEEQTESRNGAEQHCVDALTSLSMMLENLQEGSSRYSVAPCDYRGTGEKGDGERTQAILAASTMLLQFYPYPQGMESEKIVFQQRSNSTRILEEGDHVQQLFHIVSYYSMFTIPLSVIAF